MHKVYSYALIISTLRYCGRGFPDRSWRPQEAVKDRLRIHVEAGDDIVVIDVPHRRPDRAGRIELGEGAVARADVAAWNAVGVQINPGDIPIVVDAAFSPSALHGIGSIVHDERAVRFADQGMQ